ncbi:hypothetical protein [Enterocloster hominis (ex Hitch et al. 2024)]|uniref:Uncharacterized protein n=1 Tax=Enterocloster hominis (ex Hitch et al. 2024) TaxID=1917870 RepID=A0ABV1D411_9FIRM|nr:hypothetical protein [Lachnoclostridium pacaense]
MKEQEFLLLVSPDRKNIDFLRACAAYTTRKAESYLSLEMA